MSNFTPAIDHDELVGAYKKAICITLTSLLIERMKNDVKGGSSKETLPVHAITLNMLAQNPEMLKFIKIFEDERDTFIKIQYSGRFEVANEENTAVFLFGGTKGDLVFNLDNLVREGYVQNFAVNMLKDAVESLKRVCPMVEEEW